MEPLIPPRPGPPTPRIRGLGRVPAAKKSTLGWILPEHSLAQLSLCLHLAQLRFNPKLTFTQHFLWKVRTQNRLVIKAQGFQVQPGTLWINFGALLASFFKILSCLRPRGSPTGPGQSLLCSPFSHPSKKEVLTR